MTPEVKYGLLAGAGIGAWTTLEYLAGFHTTHLAVGEYTGYGATLIPLTTLFLLLKGKAATAPEGRLTLWQGVNAGLASSLIAALVVYVYLLSYDLFINPGWLDHALEWQVAQLRAAGVDEPAIREEITFQRRTRTPFGLAATTLVGQTLLGACLSLILTFLIRFRRSAPPSSPAAPSA